MLHASAVVQSWWMGIVHLSQSPPRRQRAAGGLIFIPYYVNPPRVEILLSGTGMCPWTFPHFHNSLPNLLGAICWPFSGSQHRSACCRCHRNRLFTSCDPSTPVCQLRAVTQQYKHVGLVKSNRCLQDLNLHYLRPKRLGSKCVFFFCHRAFIQKFYIHEGSVFYLMCFY